MLLSVAQVATLINLGMFIVQFMLGLGLVLCLISFIKTTNSAVTWSNLAKTLHSSLWPTILSTDSASRKGLDRRVSLFNGLVIVTWILTAVAGVITPLGLDTGRKERPHQTVRTRYVMDDSNVGKSMSPRDAYRSGRYCGVFGYSTADYRSCPGQDIHSGIIPSNITSKFSSEYSTLTMQFRNFYNGVYKEQYGDAVFSVGYMAQMDTFTLREGIFGIEGAVVDVGKHPGIGLLNHTFPTIDNDGASWTQDVLWIEPVTVCVNTNLTLEYTTADKYYTWLTTLDIVDHGGFYNLTDAAPNFADYGEGQKGNLWEHAFAGATRLNFIMMDSRNISQNETFEGYRVPTNRSSIGGLGSLSFGELGSMLMDVPSTSDAYCQGGGDLTFGSPDLRRIAVYCSFVTGIPNRLDHRDSRRQGANVTWYQPLHVCASATRLAIQTLKFGYNGTIQRLSDLNIKRDPENVQRNVLWGMEKLDSWSSVDIEPVYGKVNDEWQDDPDLHTLRSDRFYVPRGSSDRLQGSSMLDAAWSAVHSHTKDDHSSLGFYSGDSFQLDGSSSFALLAKWRSYYQDNPDTAPAKVANLMFTDRIANNLVGTAYANTLNVRPSDTAITYDIIFAIPALIILSIWVPVLVYTAILLLTGKVTFDYLRFLLNQTSIGRTVVGDSYFRVVKEDSEDHTYSPVSEKRTGPSQTSASPRKTGRKLIDDTYYTASDTFQSRPRMTTRRWLESGGKTLLTLSVPTSHRKTEKGMDRFFVSSVSNSLNDDQGEGDAFLSTSSRNVNLPRPPDLENEAHLGGPEDRWKHSIDGQ
ncbi:hypothetical protein BT69DRAFT_920478 [Atractiella rhizophila]|nr:hypothetical protein BT69DRAFT_920478 [Atractiella rhizophila]